jgi:hypothetical protein
MIAVVGSQSTGNSTLMQAKAHYLKVSLESNSYPKVKELSPEGPLKFNSAKFKVKSNTLNLSIKKANITKTWISSGNSSTSKPKKHVARTKASAASLSESGCTPKRCWTCF